MFYVESIEKNEQKYNTSPLHRIQLDTIILNKNKEKNSSWSSAPWLKEMQSVQVVSNLKMLSV